MDPPQPSLFGIPQELRDKIWMNLLRYEKPIQITTLVLRPCPSSIASATTTVSYAKTAFFRSSYSILAKSDIPIPSASSIYGSGNDLPVQLCQNSRDYLHVCKTPGCTSCPIWQRADTFDCIWDDYSALDVFFVNHQVYREASQIFYRSNTFLFTLTSAKNDNDIVAFASFLDDRPLHVRSSLRYLSIELLLPAGVEPPNAPTGSRLDWQMMKHLKALLMHDYSIRDLEITVEGPTFLTNERQYFALEAKAERERALAIVNMFSAFRTLQKFHITVRQNDLTTDQASRDIVRLLDDGIVGKVHDLKDEDIVYNAYARPIFGRIPSCKTFSFERRIG